MGNISYKVFLQAVLDYNFMYIPSFELKIKIFSFRALTFHVLHYGDKNVTLYYHSQVE